MSVDDPTPSDSTASASHDGQTRDNRTAPAGGASGGAGSGSSAPGSQSSTQGRPGEKTALDRPAMTTPSPYGPGNEPGEASGALPQSLQSRYRLVRVLGRGGFANVYLAKDSVLDQEVAIKILKLGLTSRTDHERFLFEARIGAKLRHPNIATVLDVIKTADGLQMVMEYYPEGTLADLIRKKGMLRPRVAIDIIRQVAQALAHAHRNSFVHRDVKPAKRVHGRRGNGQAGRFRHRGPRPSRTNTHKRA